jgi:N-acylneuraminate cytidylyltransferase
MVALDQYGFANVVIASKSGIFRRQDSQKVFDMTTAAYVIDAKFIMEHDGIFEGRVKAIHLPLERAIDIDTSLDFEIAEFLYLRRNRTLL